MKDTFGRTIDYLRISVTDLCNLRCVYCMEAQGIDKCAHREILSFEQIVEIAQAAVQCGVKKIRLTGGEPLVRRGIVTLCRNLREIDGMEELSVTTNGTLLPQMAVELKDAGVDRLNISIDTLQAEKYRSITRGGDIVDVFRGLQAAERAGFRHTKLNTVLLGGINTDEIADFVALTKEQPICLRFIELMPIGVCAAMPKERFVSAEAVLQMVPSLRRIAPQGVAEIYQIPGYQGTVGLIRAVSNRFCAQCNRIRLTADGKLKPCLHSAQEISVRELHGQALLHAVKQAIQAKPERHFLNEQGRSQSQRSMYQIGG